MVVAEAVRVVLADDNAEFCRSVAEHVRKEADIELSAVVHDGWAALEAVARCAPDLLLLDLIMPHLDGIGVLERLGGDRPRVLAVTGFAQEELIGRALVLGADYCVMKPFDLPTLVERIRQVAHPASARSGLPRELRRRRVEREIIRQLCKLGVPPHYRGYTYLK